MSLRRRIDTLGPPLLAAAAIAVLVAPAIAGPPRRASARGFATNRAASGIDDAAGVSAGAAGRPARAEAGLVGAPGIGSIPCWTTRAALTASDGRRSCRDTVAASNCRSASNRSRPGRPADGSLSATTTAGDRRSGSSIWASAAHRSSTRDRDLIRRAVVRPVRRRHRRVPARSRDRGRTSACGAGRGRCEAAAPRGAPRPEFPSSVVCSRQSCPGARTDEAAVVKSCGEASA